MGEPPTMAGLTVAVLTYRRPELLQSLLTLVRERSVSVPDVECDVLVVDNDPEASAARVVRGAGAWVRYVHEPVAGIAAARRRALAETRHRDLVLFLDDDLRPEVDWLPPLVSLWRETGAAAVLGHVAYEFDPRADPLVRAGGFFRRAVHPTGTTLPTGATGNLLLDRRQVEELGVDFDPSWGMSGGEDTLFCSRLVASGGRIVFCAESVVVGRLPLERTSRTAALIRARAHAGIGVRVRLALASDARERTRVRTRAVTGGVARVLTGTVLTAAGSGTGNLERQARGLRMRARGVGMTAAGLGRFVEEYARPQTEGTPS